MSVEDSVKATFENVLVRSVRRSDMSLPASRLKTPPRLESKPPMVNVVAFAAAANARIVIRVRLKIFMSARNRDFPFGFLFMVGGGGFCDFLPGQRRCKLNSACNGGFSGTPHGAVAVIHRLRGDHLPSLDPRAPEVSAGGGLPSATIIHD